MKKRIYVIGDYYVGKSTLVSKLLYSISKIKVETNMPNDLISVHYVIESNDIEYEIYDIKTNDLFFIYHCAEIAKSADLILMVYDIGEIKTLRTCMRYMNVISNIFTTYKPIVFVGNKMDRVTVSQNYMNLVFKQIFNMKHLNYEIVKHILISSFSRKNLGALHKLMIKELRFKV